jgi:hypothetical protein
MCFRFGKVKQLARPYFWLFFGVLSLLRVLVLVTLQLLGKGSAIH